MMHLDDAVTKYHRLLESPTHSDLNWAKELHQLMENRGLVLSGRPVSQVLRPHLLTRTQYENVSKASSALNSAVSRVKQIALETPALLQRMELLPAEKMLAALDPGYPYFTVASLPDMQVENGTMRFVSYSTDVGAGLATSEILSELFYEAAPVKEFRKSFKLIKFGATQRLLDSLLRAYKGFGGSRQPNIAIVEFKQPFQTLETLEFSLLKQKFQQKGYATEVVTPEQLEYRNGILSAGNFRIDIIYRGVRAQEFLVRYDLTHPMVRAYKEGAVCMVNSFQSELAEKRAIFDLLTDETITSSFPADERRVLRDYIPWTRVVTSAKTVYQDKPVDLPDFILRNRENLILRPNDENMELHTVRGWESDAGGWERALRQAMRTPYVVQEKVTVPTTTFPVYQWGQLAMHEMNVEVHPHVFLGKADGASSWVSEARNGNFSMLAGFAPTFMLENK